MRCENNEMPWYFPDDVIRSSASRLIRRVHEIALTLTNFCQQEEVIYLI